ncbi:MAG: Fe-S protein assembly co-chaperone HscB [Acidobacteria bacterium]|nr:MAG: Fe-S protein assembly co-chaperone HscB [Acidobacteriota bacterium]
MCRSCGAGAPVDAHFCPQCSKILSLGRHGDYFAFMGLPRKLKIDSRLLEERFRGLSRQFHPDYFYNADPGERRASLERSSYLNDAYRTLRNPISRIEYLLSARAGQRPRRGRRDSSARARRSTRSAPTTSRSSTSCRSSGTRPWTRTKEQTSGARF